jgi:hypothetical protein
LAGGNKVVVFEVRDDCTRLLVAAHAAPDETAQAAIEAITTSRSEYGAPGIVLCDNGSAARSARHPRGTDRAAEGLPRLLQPPPPPHCARPQHPNPGTAGRQTLGGPHTPTSPTDATLHRLTVQTDGTVNLGKHRRIRIGRDTPTTK